jgi:type IV fimbrial biogenesis protein FimT
MRLSRQSGFTMIELMVTIAIIAIALALGVPFFNNATTGAKERGVIAKLQQDFAWARTAAGVRDQSVLNSSASGQPVIKIKLWPDCHWDTTIDSGGTVTDTVHSMTYTQLSSVAPGISCPAGSGSSALALPVTFKFSPDGTVDTSGLQTFHSSRGTDWPLIFMLSGTVLINQGLS